MSDWQPIETAPKDETILVHYDSGEIELITAADNYYDWVAYDGKNEGRLGISKPTHWMPLPEPPSSPSGGEAVSGSTTNPLTESVGTGSFVK